MFWHMHRNEKESEMSEKSTNLVKVDSPHLFPFKLEDLKSWTIKRTDGTITKYVLTTSPVAHPSTKTEVGSVQEHKSPTYYSGYGDFCTHKPDNTPIVEFDRSKDLGVLRLNIGNMSGARATKDTFDFVIDCGDIFSTWQVPDEPLSGDKELAVALAPYTVAVPLTRILKIDWDDRQAPNVVPEFWVELSKRIYGDVMTCCVGGHGRSGTSFVCLLLCNAPDYDAKDAIIHVRAVHCPRAIESVMQHQYIDDVAKFLGRTQNAKEAISGTPDYKAAFMASKKPTAVATRKMLGWDKEKGK